MALMTAHPVGHCGADDVQSRRSEAMAKFHLDLSIRRPSGGRRDTKDLSYSCLNLDVSALHHG